MSSPIKSPRWKDLFRAPKRPRQNDGLYSAFTRTPAPPAGLNPYTNGRGSDPAEIATRVRQARQRGGQARRRGRRRPPPSRVGL